MKKYNLLYIGKSNRKFTHNKMYNYVNTSFNTNQAIDKIYADINKDLHLEKHGFHSSSLLYFHITIKANNQLVILKIDHIDYFLNNFKLIDEYETKRIVRKLKLKKIQNGL